MADHYGNNTAADIAVLQEKAQQQARETAELKGLIRDLSTKVDTVQATLSEARGGWRTLMWIGGAAAAVSSAVTWALTHLGVPIK